MRDPFARVEAIGLSLPGVTMETKYDASPVLRYRGAFLAGLAGDDTEPGTLVVRCEPHERQLLLAEAPHVYYLNDRHRRYPVVLARLSQLDDDALRGLLLGSLKLTQPKAKKRRPIIQV